MEEELGKMKADLKEYFEDVHKQQEAKEEEIQQVWL